MAGISEVSGTGPESVWASSIGGTNQPVVPCVVSALGRAREFASQIYFSFSASISKGEVSAPSDRALSSNFPDDPVSISVHPAYEARSPAGDGHCPLGSRGVFVEASTLHLEQIIEELGLLVSRERNELLRRGSGPPPRALSNSGDGEDEQEGDSDASH